MQEAKWLKCEFHRFNNGYIILVIAAIAAEKKIQRDTIRKQRDDYARRAAALKRELITLKEQREEMTGDEPPSPTTNNFISENDRLQVNTNRRLFVELQHQSAHFILFVIFSHFLSSKSQIHFLRAWKMFSQF